MTILHTTELLTYNVDERGRKHLGVDRNIDHRSLAAAIRSPATQEKIRGGDMLGFYGHWQRRVFGMEPQEGGIVDGKVITLEPALKTVELSIDDYGNISHREAFIDTPDGQKALLVYRAGVGGFSTAMTPAKPVTSPAMIRTYHGTDFVYVPNYSTNRRTPVMLDSAVDDDALLDAVSDLIARCDSSLGSMLAGLQHQHALVLDQLEYQIRQNDLLVARLAATGRPAEAGMLDSATFSRPGWRDISKLAEFKSFSLADAAGLESSGSPTKVTSPEERGMSKALRILGG